MIERDPHGVFAGAWAGWFACVLYALTQPNHPALGLWVLIAFLPLEGAGIAWRTRFGRTVLHYSGSWPLAVGSPCRC